MSNENTKEAIAVLEKHVKDMCKTHPSHSEYRIGGNAVVFKKEDKVFSIFDADDVENVVSENAAFKAAAVSVINLLDKKGVLQYEDTEDALDLLEFISGIKLESLMFYIYRLKSSLFKTKTVSLGLDVKKYLGVTHTEKAIGCVQNSYD